MEYGDIFSAISMFVWTLIGYSIYHRLQSFKIFRKLDIQGPDPSFLFGNAREVPVGTDQPVLKMAEWQKKYGKVYGYFRYTEPCLVVADLDLVRQITIRDFHIFEDRFRSRITMKAVHNSLIGMTGKRWKDVRKILTPTFSAAKLKIILPMMSKLIDQMYGVMETKVGTEVDIYDLFERLTVAVIGEAALAVKIDTLGNENEPIFRKMQAFLKSASLGKISSILKCFPAITPIFQLFVKYVKIEIVDDIINNLLQVIKHRRAQGNAVKAVDILQLMLEASENPSEEVNDEWSAEVKIPEKNSSEKASNKIKFHNLANPLTDDEIASNCWIFLLAGFETTGTTLAYIAHNLVMYPDVQEKVYQEIIDRIKDDHSPTYEDVNNLPYLDQVINETLRIYPPLVLFMTRSTAEDYDLNGYKIPKGMKVEVPIYNIHHDPDYWPEPEKFDPERFSAENRGSIHPMAHIPFGAGPRNCIGSRFALLEIKCAFARLLRHYKLVPSAKTVHPPEVYVPHQTFVPKNGIYVKIEKRSN